MKTDLFIKNMTLSFAHDSLEESDVFLESLQRQINDQKNYNNTVRQIKKRGIENWHYNPSFSNVEQVKRLRNAFGMGLKEAHEIVVKGRLDWEADEHPENHKGFEEADKHDKLLHQAIQE